MGAIVETLETSHTWIRLGELHAAVRGALARRAAPARARPGSSSATSPTPTPTAPRSTSPSSRRARHGAEIEQWREIKAAACEAIVAAGGTITHHHAVGRDHAPYMEAEVGGPASTRCARSRTELDPAGIMNPGKLICPSSTGGCSHASDRGRRMRGLSRALSWCADIGAGDLPRISSARIRICSALLGDRRFKVASVVRVRSISLKARGRRGRAPPPGSGSWAARSPESGTWPCRRGPCLAGMGEPNRVGLPRCEGSRPSAVTCSRTFLFTAEEGRAAGVAAVDRREHGLGQVRIFGAVGVDAS